MEIVHCAVFMADGIPVFQYAKVSRLFCFHRKEEILTHNSRIWLWVCVCFLPIWLQDLLYFQHFRKFVYCRKTNLKRKIPFEPYSNSDPPRCSRFGAEEAVSFDSQRHIIVLFSFSLYKKKNVSQGRSTTEGFPVLKSLQWVVHSLGRYRVLFPQGSYTAWSMSVHFCPRENRLF